MTRRVVDRTPKSCLHKVANHQHGTRSCYTLDRCRCAPCTAASAAYESNRIRQHAYGRWDNLVDAEPARQHIRSLGEQGMGRHRIQVVAGLSEGQLWKLMYGTTKADGSRTPSKRIKREISERILQIQLDPADGALVPAVGATRRVQALVALGWSQRRICTALGFRFPTQLTDLVKGRLTQITVGHDRRVRKAYDRLSMQLPPASNQRERISVSRARNLAKARGWLPPLAWDDEALDDPSAVPTKTTVGDPDYLDNAAIERRMAGDRAVELTKQEKAELVRRMTAAGVGSNEIERRTGLNPQRTLKQAS